MVCELAVSGSDNDKPRTMLGSCKILVMASDLQSARSVQLFAVRLEADLERSV